MCYKGLVQQEGDGLNALVKTINREFIKANNKEKRKEKKNRQVFLPRHEESDHKLDYISYMKQKIPLVSSEWLSQVATGPTGLFGVLSVWSGLHLGYTSTALKLTQ